MQTAADRTSTNDPSLTVLARLRDKPGAYDRVDHRLEPMPIEACLATYDHTADRD